MKIVLNIDRKRGIIVGAALALTLVGVVAAQTYLLTGQIGTITVSLAPGTLDFVSAYANTFNGQTCTVSGGGSTLTCPASSNYANQPIVVSFEWTNPEVWAHAQTGKVSPLTHTPLAPYGLVVV